MSTATQISSFRIPADVWQGGHPSRPDLPPLQLPARDALDIERRAAKDVNLRNETQRYVLCCARIQGIVLELSGQPGVLNPPLVWLPPSQAQFDQPSAVAYLAIMEVLGRRIRRSNAYPRVAALFFPPNHARLCLQTLSAVLRNPSLEVLLKEAAKHATPLGQSRYLEPARMRLALDQRCAFLEEVGASCVVDVVELV